MRGFILGVVITLLVLVVGVFAVAKFGMVNISAEAPMNSIEKDIAEMAMDSGVDKAAPHVENPIQPTEDNLMTGAMLYEKNCSTCHGSIADKGRVSPMSQAFYPRVPQITRRIPGDEDWHLFWVTKKGIRWTGMAAWGKTMKDDDIWRVITFIKHSDKLPPSVQEMWQTYATPSGIAPPSATKATTASKEKQK
jgi:mono/diheme cytochrome c family protein